jgi:RNA recognition motif-containing protein
MNHMRVYVGDISATVEQSQLESYFPANITIKQLRLMPSSVPGVNCFAIIETNTPEDARAIVEALDGLEVNGIRMYAHTQPAARKPRTDRSDGH